MANNTVSVWFHNIIHKTPQSTTARDFEYKGSNALNLEYATRRKTNITRATDIIDPSCNRECDR